MKDSYSFDIDDAGLQISYEKHRNAYIKTFQRLGLNFNIVSAMSGAMGGSRSEEFLAPCPTGEDTYVLCPSCGYAANVEAMVTKVAPYTGESAPAMELFDSPNTPTIDSLVALLNEKFGSGYQASDTLKNVLLMADDQAISVLVPGDREVDLKRLGANLPGVNDLRLFEDSDFEKHPGLVKGYVGPQDAAKLGITVYADPRITHGSVWVTGANERDKHVRYVTNGRDFQVSAYIEAAEVRAGDACPQCQTPVVIDRAIEIGHIFQLGRKYAEALDLTVLNQEGKSQVVTMGSYGIGVSRAVAAIAEQNHDELGLVWPREVAPADIHIVATGKDEAVQARALELAQELEAAGLEVFLDDRRDASPGVKFKDAELIGIPYIVIVGKALAEGKLELRDRKSGIKSEIADADALALIAAALANSSSTTRAVI
jgi:prolyl-tRNA synthetase